MRKNYELELIPKLTNFQSCTGLKLISIILGEKLLSISYRDNFATDFELIKNYY